LRSRMFFADVVNSGTVPALEKVLAFTEARQRMLAENIANVDTPNYRTKQLDVAAFQGALRTALDDRRQSGSSRTRRGAESEALCLPANSQFWQDDQGRLVVQPSEVPAENLLFHDDTNARIERQMAMMAENTMMHQAATELLRSRFDGLLKAIRGRIG